MVRKLLFIFLVCLSAIPTIFAETNDPDLCSEGFIPFNNEYIIRREYIYGIPFDLVALEFENEVGILTGYFIPDELGQPKGNIINDDNRITRPLENTIVSIPVDLDGKTLLIEFTTCQAQPYLRLPAELMTEMPPPLEIPAEPVGIKVCGHPDAIVYERQILLLNNHFFGSDIGLIFVQGSDPNELGELPVGTVAAIMETPPIEVPTFTFVTKSVVAISGLTDQPLDDTVRYVPFTYDDKTVQFIAIATCNGSLTYLLPKPPRGIPAIEEPNDHTGTRA